MTIKAAIFDRDGVLTDFDTTAAADFFADLLPISIFELAGRWQMFGARRGFPRSLHEEADFFAEFWNQLATELDLTVTKRAELHRVDYARFVAPFPEASSVLSNLHTEGIRIGVLSNFTLASLDRSLEAAGLSQWIDVACAATVIGTAKPAPSAYQIMLAALGAEAEQCLYFDDEWKCVEGGRQVGLQAYLVDRAQPQDMLVAAIVSSLKPALELARRG